MSWGVYQDPNSEYHTVPMNDIVEHDYEDCVCGMDTEAVKREDGSVGWVYKHHSLDGRELKE